MVETWRKSRFGDREVPWEIQNKCAGFSKTLQMAFCFFAFSLGGAAPKLLEIFRHGHIWQEPRKQAALFQTPPQVVARLCIRHFLDRLCSHKSRLRSAGCG